MACGIFCVGHILVDMRVRVAEFSRSDQETAIQEVSYGVGGSAANVAIGVTRLGGSSMLLGKIGMDTFGRMAVDELIRERIGLGHVRVDLQESTGFTIIIINKAGEVLMFGSKGASDSLQPHEVTEIKPRGCEYLHIASLRTDTALAAAKFAKENGLFVTYDPGRELARKGMQVVLPFLPCLDLLLLNGKEAEGLTGISDPGEAAAALRKAGVRNVAVKLGSKGVHVLFDGLEKTVPAFRVEAIDTTGAGDAFATGLLTALGEGRGIEESVRFANAVAALKVTRLGSHAIPMRDEVEDFLKKRG